MRRLIPLFALVASTLAWGDPPAMVRATEGPVSIEVPAEWHVLIDLPASNVTTSRDVFTTLKVNWYDYKPRATPDFMIDIMVKTVSDNLPFSTVTELSRADLPGVAGKQAICDVSVLGRTMKLGVVAIVDHDSKHLLAGTFLTSPEAFEALGGSDTLARITRSLTLPMGTDPREAKPTP